MRPAASPKGAPTPHPGRADRSPPARADTRRGRPGGSMGKDGFPGAGVQLQQRPQGEEGEAQGPGGGEPPRALGEQQPSDGQVEPQRPQGPCPLRRGGDVDGRGILEGEAPPSRRRCPISAQDQHRMEGRCPEPGPRAGHGPAQPSPGRQIHRPLQRRQERPRRQPPRLPEGRPEQDQAAHQAQASGRHQAIREPAPAGPAPEVEGHQEQALQGQAHEEMVEQGGGGLRQPAHQRLDPFHSIPRRMLRILRPEGSLRLLAGPSGWRPWRGRSSARTTAPCGGNRSSRSDDRRSR